MTTPVLICDDSSFARKQMARSIPDDWDVTITYAENGQEAIAQIEQGHGDVLFLDLNMPVMDGYETMQVIRERELPTLVIVVSGDVQPQARQRMLEMGAIDFIRKPINNEKLVALLRQYGLYSGDGSAASKHIALEQPVDTTELEGKEQLDAYRELVNVAMGRAGESLAMHLNQFIDLPIPNVNVIETSELRMAIEEISANDQVSAVSKGFISAGINGEALVIFSDACVDSMLDLLDYGSTADSEQLQLEALMDISNILIGACLNGLSEQLNVSFSHTSPIILGQHQELEGLIKDNVSRWRKVMAIEIAYSISSHNINFDLLLLITEQSMEKVYSRLTDILEYAE